MAELADQSAADHDLRGARAVMWADIALIVAGMLMYEAGPGPLPEPMREAAAEVAPQAYAAHCERVHGTPLPPRSTGVVIGTPFVGVPAGVAISA